MTTTQTQAGSQHLAVATELLADLGDAHADTQAKASAAIAHSILVLAEQVAAIRLTVTAQPPTEG